jgi:rSAM/selenodomain-associated transferase 1
MISGSKYNAVALFVRNPVPGRVKTRLGHDIGYENACNFYQTMVKDILSNIVSINLPVYLFHDGISPNGLPQEWIDASYAVVAQQGDNIGERMAAAFNLLFSDNLQNVALLGSDIPGLDSQLLIAAFQSIESHDVAIVPAYDGGYCLIALRNISHCQRFFQNIEWSTSLVTQATIDRFNQYGLRVKLLESRQDIDTFDDLKAYCHNPSAMARKSNEWLAVSGYLSSQSNVINYTRQATEPGPLNTCNVDIAQRLQGK